MIFYFLGSLESLRSLEVMFLYIFLLLKIICSFRENAHIQPFVYMQWNSAAVIKRE
jgi:hypothetical protein